MISIRIIIYAYSPPEIYRQLFLSTLRVDALDVLNGRCIMLSTVSWWVATGSEISGKQIDYIDQSHPCLSIGMRVIL